MSIVPLLFALASSPSMGTESDPPPNIVVMFCDDLGWGDLGCYGNPVIRTPELDRLAAEGMRFTDFHSASPACTASRYGLLTGRLPARSGFAWVLNPDSKAGLAPAERTLAEELRAAGYATALFGKWHLGCNPGRLPLDHGFDEFFGFPYSNDMLHTIKSRDYPKIPLYDGKQVIERDPDQTTLTRRITERAVDFIHRKKNAPFFLYIPHPMPHLPLHPGKDFAGRSPRGTYGDVIEELDWSAGEVTRALTKAGVAENTLFFFTSDNGPWIIKNERGGSSGPLLDGKGSTWEGGIRVPGIAWWPQTIEAGQTCRALASTLDFLPTFTALAGRPPIEDRPLDGRDLQPLLKGQEWDDQRLLPIHGLSNEVHGIRMGPWKLLVKTNSQTGKVPHEGRTPLLFQLEQDPGERFDRSESEPRVLQRMQRALEAHRKSLEKNPPFQEDSQAWP
ncbi:MAG: sulfatase [Planctomycetes bacterium]|nr:sulfatase [Planctomycetota bacterium]